MQLEAEANYTQTIVVSSHTMTKSHLTLSGVQSLMVRRGKTLANPTPYYKIHCLDNPGCLYSLSFG